ncbi:OB-fold domain-containing protein [Frankia sp. AiPs1]|uniref:Zn-ribbon domain-containing OB-fold protein n=1 Tax=Frankia sp. AiPs1 TaxID=573493 RepID=UPI00204417A1|nr:OB-fold domain-containing protein [Frankia sp. AiPs1]MCM3921584.1 OB-fold domain-containing protein [Frankia sp. AiPs1]
MTQLRRGVFPARLTDPMADERTQPFWDAALAGRLSIARCDACGTFVFPAEPFCFTCQGDAFTYTDLPGTGTIYTFTVVRHPLAPQLADVVPYVSGVVELDGTQGAGCRVIANIVDVDPETVQIGDRVRIRFDRITDTYAVPRFVPDAG